VPADRDPISASPLPERWSAPERVEDVIDADGLRLHRVGLASRSDHGEAVGSAADREASPVERAMFELIERIAVIEASKGSPALRALEATGEPIAVVSREHVFPTSPRPEVWTYARSSGVALHADWRRACERAEQELVERDRVLRAWLGDIVPRTLALDVASLPLGKTRSYEWRACSFPALPEDVFGRGTEVVGLFGFPTAEHAPLVFGYGARPSIDEALAAAVREALQQLAFLWGEPLPDRLPDPAPTPMAHLERFQVPVMHSILRGWLAGDHAGHRRGAGSHLPAAHPRWVDLTPAWLTSGLRVAKALSTSAIPLTFGDAPAFAHLPAELRIHPIP
jgi:hypothetical protein